jgi:hypothetical protein
MTKDRTLEGWQIVVFLKTDMRTLAVPPLVVNRSTRASDQRGILLTSHFQSNLPSLLASADQFVANEGRGPAGTIGEQPGEETIPNDPKES